jgi:uncharacterized protein (DUF1778 family)
MARAKFNILLTLEEKTLLEQATQLNGESISNFIRRLALPEARRVLAQAGATVPNTTETTEA